MRSGRTSRSSATNCIRCVKVTDFSPYIAKIKASGADTVITGNWGADFSLLLKAAADAGLQVNWYTYYAGAVGGPTAVRQTGLADHVFEISEGVVNSAPQRRRNSRRTSAPSSASACSIHAPSTS